MGLIMLMEDSSIVNSSAMLNTVFNICYSNGNGNLVNKMKKLGNKDIIVFVDMVPDNAQLRRVYNNVKRHVRKYCDNCYVIPVICTEDFILRSLDFLGIELRWEIEGIKMKAAYQSWKEKKPVADCPDISKLRFKEDGFDSFEKVAKTLLKNANNYEFNIFAENISRESTEFEGLYYTTQMYEIPIEKKAEAVGSRMPIVVFKTWSKYFDKFKPITNLKEKEAKCQELHEQWILQYSKEKSEV